MLYMKKWVSIILAAIVFMTSSGVTIFANSRVGSVKSENAENKIFSGEGDGTESNPYEITNAQQLDEVRYDLDAYYVLQNNIDLSSISNWIPIGNETNPFKGSFDGNNKTISDMRIRVSYGDIEYVGLFGYCIDFILIKNVNLDRVDIYTEFSTDVGAIAGYIRSAGRVEGCSVSGNIGALDAGVGGIVGQAYYGDIDNCVNRISITVSNSGYTCVGGISGYQGGTVSDSRNYGNIIIENLHNSSYIGGICGKSDGTINKCINYGNIEGSSNIDAYSFEECTVGGIVGLATDNINSSVNFGDVKSNCNGTGYGYTGGIIGYRHIGLGGEKTYNCINACQEIIAIKSEQAKGYGIGRIVGGSEVADSIEECYSLDTTTCNGVVPTENIGINSANGESMNLEMLKKILVSNNVDIPESTDESDIPSSPDNPDAPSQPVEAAAFSLPKTATNILTGNEVKLSGSMQLTDVLTDMEEHFNTETSGIAWNSSNEDIISASDIKCVKMSEKDLSGSCELSITMPVKKCGEVTITGTTRNGISASTKVEVFPKMTIRGYSVDAGDKIYRNVCTVTLDQPDKSFLEQFMPKLQLDDNYIVDEQDFTIVATRCKATRYAVSNDGKMAGIEAAFESVGPGSRVYAVRYHGCSEVLKTFSVQSNLHSWSDVRDKELSKMNEDQNQAYSEIQNALGDFRDKFQEFIDSLRADAEKKGGNALESSNTDLAKKLEEECGAEISLTGPVFEDQKRGGIRKKFIYTELSKKLASIANAQMGSIKVSDQDKAPKNIVDNVVRGYHYIDGTVQSEDKKMELNFDITGMYNTYFGSIWFIEAGAVSRQMVTVNMTRQHLENALQQYAKDLAQLQSDAGDAIYSAMAKDLLGKSISDFVGDEFSKSFSKYEPQLEKWGVKGILDFGANCYTVYEKASAIDVSKIVNNTDIGGIAEELEKVKGLLDVELKGFTNKAAKKAGKKVVKAAEYLYKICKDYTEDGKITEKYSLAGWWKYTINCPVEVYVYDAEGQQIGYAGEDDLDYDPSIMIEEAGDAKVLYIPAGKEVTYKINGTGYGQLNCSFEESDQDGMAVGRLNYYDIDLTPESKIEAVIPSDGFVLNNSDLPITVNGVPKAPDVCLESKDYEFVDIKAAADDPDGGIFRGAGKYVPGDAVNLVAVPNSGYIFAGWYDGGDNFVSMNRNIEFAARNSGNYTAKFLKLQGTANGTVKSVRLSKTSYEYNGKSRKPSVIAVDTERKRISSKYYKVKYKNNKKVGKATVTIKFKDGYEGTVKKAFTIRPSKAYIQKLTAASRGFTVKWGRKTTQTDGYQIQYSTGKKFTKSKAVTKMVKNAYIDSIDVKKLEPGKRYYVRIRTYKTVNGKKYHSVWSKIKGVATKK